ncbi:uncharacterized protein LOC127902975 [Citrus sinensis]|uniref:uncharacterized protein LOC127902975 n=1 Tax=Citrus sinensis TaxID=2711 RepID=UPI002277A7C6|nr:uncharacterized protein LOC127902975 [Citrus sinensis]
MCGGTGAEISCSSTSTSSARSISCKRHKIIPARGREARRPGRRQLARHALQPENLGTTATLSPEPWRNTQDPTFSHNAAVRVPLHARSHRITTTTLSPEPWRNTQDPTFAHNAAVRVPYRLAKSEKRGFGEAYKKVANEGTSGEEALLGDLLVVVKLIEQRSWSQNEENRNLASTVPVITLLIY